MKENKFVKEIKKAWNWIWNSDSILSWVVALVLIFVIIKYIFFPGLSLIMGTSLPLAGVESSSMDHRALNYCDQYDTLGNCLHTSSNYEICGINFNQKTSFNIDSYWETCGSWYKDDGITKDQFKTFSMPNGFSKGDIIIVWGRFTPKIGDIIIFKPNENSNAPRPIIHRVVKIDSDGSYETKGDHNEKQLTADNNIYSTDETHITKDQIIGKAVFKIPYLGWLKIGVVDFVNLFVHH